MFRITLKINGMMYSICETYIHEPYRKKGLPDRLKKKNKVSYSKLFIFQVQEKFYER